MKIVFMGTPDFAQCALKALYDAGHEILAVVTQPDRQKGRGKAVATSPVKDYATAKNIPVLQPARVRDEEAVEALRELHADVFVVAAFGQILPETVLQIPPYGCINIHASLLPKLRGAAPIQQAIMDGETKTGVTIMQMDKGCDTGDILYQEEITIEETDTGGTLFDKLAALGAKTIVKTLPLIETGALTPQKQDEALATSCGKLTKETGRIDWTKDAQTLARLARATDPWPGAYTSLRGKTLKLFDAVAEAGDDTTYDLGAVVAATKDGLVVQTGNGRLRVKSLQLEGKKRMTAADFFNGSPIAEGERLG